MDEPSKPLRKDFVQTLDVVDQVCLFPNGLVLFAWEGGLVRILKVRETDSLFANAGNSLPKTTTVRNVSVADRRVAT